LRHSTHPDKVHKSTAGKIVPIHSSRVNGAAPTRAALGLNDVIDGSGY
jgi:hypothetical protein